MLLGRIKKSEYLKTVVLNVTLEENPQEIEKLETFYQLGEDEKLGYNTIEKYIKSQLLYQNLSGKKFSYLDKNIDDNAIRKIADWMGEKKSIIIDYLKVMETMDDYLDYLDYNGIYTQLDGREDHCIYLTRWLNTYYGGESIKAFDGYSNLDVDDLKYIAYDYIRIPYEGKKFRHIAHGLKENHFFGDKNIWSSFKNIHSENMDKIKEPKIDLNSQNLERHLNDRDVNYFEVSKNEKGDSFFDENVDDHYTQLRFRQSEDQPEKLIKNADRAISSINQNSKNFSNPNVMKKLEKLSSLINSMLKKSLIHIFDHIIELLESVETDNSIKDKNALLEKTKNIQRITYQIEKKIKKAK